MNKNKYQTLNIQGALLDKHELCNYLEKLASDQILKNYSNKNTYPIYSLKENFETIQKTYNLLNEHLKLNINIHPAGEWILDNFYIVEETVKAIKKDLNINRYKNLPGIATGMYKGFSRVYVLASQIVSYTDGKIDEENLKMFLNAYQSKKALTMEEIWSLPLFLQIAIIQNIRQICEKIYYAQIQKYKVENIIERLVEKKENKVFNKQISITSKNNENMKYTFIEYMSYKLKKSGKKGLIYLQVLEEQVNKMGSTVSDIIRKEHFDIAVKKVSIGNLIKSMKDISRIDFIEIFEQINGVEEILKQDPANIYSSMDYKTKSYYRSKIKEISNKTKISEIYIAKTILKMALKEKSELEQEKDKLSKYNLLVKQKKTHIGYFLLKNVNGLLKELEVNKKKLTIKEKYKLYICINLCLPIVASFFIATIKYLQTKNFLLSTLFLILTYIPLTEICIQICNYILSKNVKPTIIPKLDLSNGISKEASTFVVIPTIITSRKKVEELIKKIEVYYLANKTENMYFAILGDASCGALEEEKFDNEVVLAGENLVKKLNEKYEYEVFPRFHFLYRKRRWNPKEKAFLGWERKRGLLNEFNLFLLKPETNDFKANTIIQNLNTLPNIKYIITLDADTNLVLNSGLELVGAMEHILNAPIIAENKNVVEDGHGIIQPRVGIDLDSSFKSMFSKIFSGLGGTDLYTNALFDVYQDSFDEGIFTGKGIYNLKTFEEILGNEIPENTVLSHDLLEGSYLRCGLATDILLLDGYPAKYNSFMTRLHRWTRGDFQIVRWLKQSILDKNNNLKINPINKLSKFKIFDNLRRSLVPIVAVILIILGIVTKQGVFTTIGIISILMPTILELLNRIIFKKEIEADFENASRSFIQIIWGPAGSLLRGVLELAFLPHKAYTLLNAIVKTVYRINFSKQNLLEWTTAEEAERLSKTDILSYYKEMAINVILGILLIAGINFLESSLLIRILGVLLGVLWIAAPKIAYEISKPRKNTIKLNELTNQEKEYLLEIAKKTWQYFEDNMNEENNFLPPDNVQEDRNKKVANRTSPTNIGLGLLAIVTAIDLEFIDFNNGIELLEKSITTIENLTKWNGHLYNWYNTETLEPLTPKYISSVDSGNFVGYLFVLKQFLYEKLSENDKEKTKSLINKVTNIIKKTNFSYLYNPKNKLFSIGFNIDENKLTDSYYDLLASEARQTSLISIAKKDVPQKHWTSLSRTLTNLNKYKGLISWSGTSFEYLMSNVNVKKYEGSLLDESCKFMIMCQKEYCKKLSIPWGISEAAFNLKDLNLNYQYKAFGIPWLGLKRGLADEMVVSSYGSILAIADYPKMVIENLKKLESYKMIGKYGFYESIDFTPIRLKKNEKYAVVKTYMAHHEALILLSLNNLFNDNIIQKRFSNNPEIEAVDILLQERMPKEAILTKEKKEKVEKIKFIDDIGYEERVIKKIDNKLKNCNVISNEDYTVCVDESGKGFSKYKNILINKFKTTCDYEQGIYFYIKNIKSKRIWTSSILNFLNKPDKYKITFSQDSSKINRIDGNIESKTEITVSPNEPVEIRNVELKNIGMLEETLEISTYLEPVLSNKHQDYAHPAFNNLFLEFEYIEELQSIIVKRKKRGINDKEIYLGVSFYTENEVIQGDEYEIDKAKLCGKGNINIPEMIYNSKPFTNSSKLVTEAVISMRKTMKLLQNQKIELTQIIAVSESKEEVLILLEKYRNEENIKRVFELSKARCETENRYLGINSDKASLYQKLLGYLILENPLKSLYLNNVENKIYEQNKLWKYGISGDIPIFLIKIKDVNDIDVVKEALYAKEYFNLKNIEVDLVILNEEKNIYEQYVKEKIETTILSMHIAYLLNQPNGIFIINANEIENENKELFSVRATLMLDASKGNIKSQIEELEEEYLERTKSIGEEIPNTIITSSENSNVININSEELKYYNEYGGFSEDGREYIIKTNKENKLPTVWSHILANERFGCVITDQFGGFTWNKNSRLNRLSAWNNMPNTDIPSEILYIKDKDTGKVWSNSSFVQNDGGDFKIIYGFGYAKFLNNYNDIVCETEVFVPKEDKVKVNIIKLTNTLANKRNLKLVYYIKPVLDEDEIKSNGYINLKKFENSIYAKNIINKEFEEIAYIGTSQNVSSYTGDKDWFIGSGNIIAPEALNKTSLDNQNALGKNSCMAICINIELEAFESQEISIFLGEEEQLNIAKEVSNKYSNLSNCKQELSKVKQYWYELLNRLQVKTPVESINIFLNGWMVYQTITSRLFARSGYYQSGGAIGFRDQLQDTIGLKYIDSEFMKNQIIKASKHQFIEGDVEHWWHEETSKGIRTRFSDDLLWLPYVVAEYIKFTNDFEILDIETNYLEGKVLENNIDEKYDVYRESNLKENIYNHCIKAIEKSLNFSEDELPKIGSGDWNDGFSTVGNKGIGQSIWLGFFLYSILEKFIPICVYKNESKRANKYEEIKEKLKKVLNSKGWDGRWYKRAYTDNGEILGSSQNEECKIDSIAQSWSVISNAGENDKKYISMSSLENYLVDNENGIIKLLDPPFDKGNLEPGYIKAYMPGIRENGGQYTHAAVWTIIAEAMLGLGNKATEYYRMINPIEHSKTKDSSKKYKIEPYVISGDVYGAGNLVGRGGWSWYTGSSSWYYNAGIEYILGLKIENGILKIEPNISSSWKDCSIRYKYGESIYNIKVKNPNEKQNGVEKFVLNGIEIPEKQIKLENNRSSNEIEITM